MLFDCDRSARLITSPWRDRNLTGKMSNYQYDVYIFSCSSWNPYWVPVICRNPTEIRPLILISQDSQWAYSCCIPMHNWKQICIVYFINILRPRQNGRHLPDDIFKCIFFNENVWISLKISLKFVPKVPINNIPALVLIMAWRRPGDKPLSEPMMVSLPTHVCVTRPQWVKQTLIAHARVETHAFMRLPYFHVLYQLLSIIPA